PRRPPLAPLVPYTTLFRSLQCTVARARVLRPRRPGRHGDDRQRQTRRRPRRRDAAGLQHEPLRLRDPRGRGRSRRLRLLHFLDVPWRPAAAAGRGPGGSDRTGVDSSGADTTDPETILDGGGIRPFGGHKGAMLSFMIETLAAGLTGGAFTFEIDAEAPEGVHTFRTGQLYIVI